MKNNIYNYSNKAPSIWIINIKSYYISDIIYLVKEKLYCGVEQSGSSFGGPVGLPTRGGKFLEEKAR